MPGEKRPAVATSLHDLALRCLGTEYDSNGTRTPPRGRPGESRDGLLLEVKNAKDFTDTFTSDTNKIMFGYADSDEDASDSGVSVTRSDGESPGNGYDLDVIADRRTKDSGEEQVPFGRVVTSAEGRPVVEIAFWYGGFNELYPGYAIAPAGLSFLLFEATRGLEGASSYFWNDKNTVANAGSPYHAQNGYPVGQPRNVYELDTLRGIIVPLPPALWPARRFGRAEGRWGIRPARGGDGPGRESRGGRGRRGSPAEEGRGRPCPGSGSSS